MGTLESLDAVLKDLEETREKVKTSVAPPLQMYSKILRATEEQYLDGSLEQEARNSKINTLNDKLQQVFDEGSLLANEKCSFMNAKKDILDRILEKEEEIQIQEKRIANRRVAVSLYKEHLSMKIKTIGGSHLLFIFKNIDPMHPDHCCLFQLLVENKIYKVTRCAPELPDVDILLSELNATNDLHKFIVSMRNKFCQSVYCS